mmetsp:Transcript_48929/g.141751  ORF Transcript_48929/g.141751 Transcript_48929/m.141751 type:complete len:442 (+) Transcript_48929:315-1640(+)
MFSVNVPFHPLASVHGAADEDQVVPPQDLLPVQPRASIPLVLVAEGLHDRFFILVHEFRLSATQAPEEVVQEGHPLEAAPVEDPAVQLALLVRPEEGVVGLEIHVHGPDPVGGAADVRPYVVKVRGHLADVFPELLKHLGVLPLRSEGPRSHLCGKLDARVDHGTAGVAHHLKPLGLLSPPPHASDKLRLGELGHRPQEGVVVAEVVPRGKLAHGPKEGEVDGQWILQQEVLVLAAHRPEREWRTLNLLDNLALLNLAALAEVEALADDHVVRGLPVNVAVIQLGDAEGEEVLHEDVCLELAAVRVGVRRDLHPVLRRLGGLEEAPGELGEEFRVELRVRLLVLHRHERLVTSTPCCIEAGVWQLLNTHNLCHSVVLRQRAEAVHGVRVPLGPELQQLLRVVRKRHPRPVARQVLLAHLLHLLHVQPLERPQVAPQLARAA